MKLFHTYAFTLIILLTTPEMLLAQNNLSKPQSIKVSNQPIQEVLTILSNQGNFNFSYNSKIIKKDSLISYTASNKPLIQILQQILPREFEYKESGNYIIIRRKPITTSNIISQSQSTTAYYIIDGFVVDEETGERIPEASIYDKNNLISTLSDERGYFVLKLKNKYNTSEISISKINYQDTSIIVKAGLNQQVSFALSRKPVYNCIETDPSLTNIVSNTSEPSTLEVEREEISKQRYLSKLILTSKRKVQNLNLKDFIVNRPFQFSVIPMISSRGKMNPQVISKTSINLFGGYCGGVSWIEIGGLFNIDKKDVKQIQLAGLFNLVGGNSQGLQASGIYNQVLGQVDGVQLGGIANIADREVKGLQAASILNLANGNVDGVQISGLANIAESKIEGMQISSLINMAKEIKGVQIGFINFTQSFSGTSIGFINIVKTPNKKKVYFIVRPPRNKKK
jgi:hypothetical protein